jgi:hypothetical protein
MKRLSNVLHRYRLMTGFLALVLLLGVLVVTPAEADIVIEGGLTCQNGCITWNQQQGCVECQRCCVKDTGEWGCWLVASNLCN